VVEVDGTGLVEIAGTDLGAAIVAETVLEDAIAIALADRIGSRAGRSLPGERRRPSQPTPTGRRLLGR
jgi:hypothetical protein